MRVQHILEVLFTVTIFFDPVSSVSQRKYGNGLARRANKAGIGVEVEFGDFTIEAKTALTSEQLEKIKGAEMIPVDFDGGRKTNWVLTAEIAGGSKALMPEAIVDGLKNEVGGHQTGDIGKEIFTFLVCFHTSTELSQSHLD
jgi:hypothetical protein